jgi:hypothetical protein
MPVTNTIGAKTAMAVRVEAVTAPATSLTPRITGAPRVVALLAAARDRLQHHDRVVDHDAHAQREAARAT